MAAGTVLDSSTHGMLCMTPHACVPAVACSPEKWKEGSSNTVESGGRKINANKALEKKAK